MTCESLLYFCENYKDYVEPHFIFDLDKMKQHWHYIQLTTYETYLFLKYLYFVDDSIKVLIDGAYGVYMEKEDNKSYANVVINYINIKTTNDRIIRICETFGKTNECKFAKNDNGCSINYKWFNPTHCIIL